MVICTHTSPTHTPGACTHTSPTHAPEAAVDGVLGADDADVDGALHAYLSPNTHGACTHTSHTHAPEAAVDSVLGADDADVNGALLPDAVGGEQVVDLVEALPELGDELVDVVHQAQR